MSSQLIIGPKDPPIVWRTHADQRPDDGYNLLEALIAATRTSAVLCGVVDRLGAIEAGKLANVIVMPANPLDNLSNT